MSERNFRRLGFKWRAGATPAVAIQQEAFDLLIADVLFPGPRTLETVPSTLSDRLLEGLGARPNERLLPDPRPKS